MTTRSSPAVLPFRSRSAHRRYLEAVVRGDRGAAAAAIDGALAAGTKPAAVLLEILAPTQGEVGERWRRGEMTVAEERWCTEMTREQLDRLRARMRSRRDLGVSCLVVAVPGERHEVPARMMADLLLGEGWRVDYLGHDVPEQEIVRYARQRRPSLVALSLTLRAHLGEARRLAGLLSGLDPRPRILLGSSAIAGLEESEVPEADGLATDALYGLSLAQELVGLKRNRDIESYLQTVGSRLQALRHEDGLSQADLARRAGLTRPYLSAVESGRQNITLEAALKLAKALGVSMSELLDEVP